MIFFRNHKSSWAPHNKILHTGWLAKFEDFTVLSVYLKSPPYISYYEYSTDFIKNKVANSTFKFYPDKIIKFQIKRPIRVGVISDWWPYGYKNTDGGLPVHMDPLLILFKSYLYFANLYNLTSKFVPSNNSKFISDKIKNSNLEFFLTTGYALKLGNFDNIYILREDKLMAIVPMTHEDRIESLMNLLYAFLKISSIILVISVASMLCQLPKKEWTILNIFSSLLGNGVPINPRNWKSKSLYIMIAFFSLFFISDLISDLTAINCLQVKFD